MKTLTWTIFWHELRSIFYNFWKLSIKTNFLGILESNFNSVYKVKSFSYVFRWFEQIWLNFVKISISCNFDADLYYLERFGFGWIRCTTWLVGTIKYIYLKISWNIKYNNFYFYASFFFFFLFSWNTVKTLESKNQSSYWQSSVNNKTMKIYTWKSHFKNHALTIHG